MKEKSSSQTFLDTTRILNRNILKYAVIVLMLIDHIVLGLAASLEYEGAFYLVGRTISRLTAPIMCFFLAEGFRYTKNIKKYILRLGIFAIISHLPFIFFETGQWLPLNLFNGNVAVEGAKLFYISAADKTLAIYKTSVIFTLFLGILALALWEKTKLCIPLKIIITIVICIISKFGDWSYWIILYVFSFYFFRKKPVLMWISYICISLLYIFGISFNQIIIPSMLNPDFGLYKTGTLLVPLIIILFYNGKPGSKRKFHKWFFYFFYPVHLFILGCIFNYWI